MYGDGGGRCSDDTGCGGGRSGVGWSVVLMVIVSVLSTGPLHPLKNHISSTGFVKLLYFSVYIFNVSNCNFALDRPVYIRCGAVVPC